jgi:hypothetical protein
MGKKGYANPLDFEGKGFGCTFAASFCEDLTCFEIRLAVASQRSKVCQE